MNSSALTDDIHHGKPTNTSQVTPSAYSFEIIKIHYLGLKEVHSRKHSAWNGSGSSVSENNM
jgi:hypothetical protein